MLERGVTFTLVLSPVTQSTSLYVLAHPCVSVPAISTPSQSQGRPEGTEEMGPWGWLGGSMWDVSEFSAQSPYVLSKLWLPMTGCREEAGETSDRGLPPLPPVPGARGESEECRHRLTPSAAPMGLCSGYEATRRNVLGLQGPASCCRSQSRRAQRLGGPALPQCNSV